MVDNTPPLRTPSPLDPPPPPSQSPAKTSRRHPPGSLLHALQSLGYIVVVAVFIITFIAQPFRIPSESMVPTLLVGDFLLVAKQDFPARQSVPLVTKPTLQRGDVIVFHYPLDPSLHLVKRIIGLPGDHLRLRNGRVFIDGQPLAEPYAFYEPGPADSFRDNFPRLQNPDPDVNSNWWIQMKQLVYRGELTVPAGHYFVLGDNRNDSEDSRYWGFVPASAIVGKPFLVYFSLDEPDDDDSPDPAAAPHLIGPAAPRTKAAFLNTLAHLGSFARWDRTLRVIR